MTVQPEDINEAEEKVFCMDRSADTLIIFVREAQPDLCDWLVAKFGTLTSPHALLGVAMLAIALTEKDKPQ